MDKPNPLKINQINRYEVTHTSVTSFLFGNFILKASVKGGNDLRVEQIGKKPKPDNRLCCLWIVVDGKPAAHDLRPSRKETAVNAERPVLHMNFIWIRRKALCMNHQLHDLHDIGNGAQNVFAAQHSSSA